MKPSRSALLVVLALLVALLLLGRPGDPLLEPEEARNAEVPRQMLVQDRWLVPIYHGQPYYDKPPLLWWLVRLSYQTFGVSDSAARLPTRLAALLCVVVVFLWGRAALGWRGAVSGAFVLCLSVRFVHLARMLTIDVLLALWVTLALAAAHRAVAGATFRRGWWLISATAAGLGLLTKGPIALVLILMPVAVWLLSTQSSRPRWFDWPLYLGVACGVAAPWFVAVALRDPAFVEHFFWRHHVLRFVEPFDHPEPFWFYLPELTLGLFPWVLMAPSLLAATARRGRRPRRRDAALRFLTLAALLGVLFFSLSGCKRSGYLVPLLPVLALALGAQLARRLRCADAPGRFVFPSVVLLTAGVAVAAWTQELLAALPAGLWLVALALLLWRRPRTAHAQWSLSGAVIAFGLMGAIHLVWPALCERFCLRTQAHLHARRAYDEDVPIFCYPGRKDSFSFYLGDRPLTCYGRDQRRQLLADLERRPRALLFLRSTREDGLLQELPPTMEVIVDRRPGLMFAVWLRRRSEEHEAAAAPPRDSLMAP